MLNLSLYRRAVLMSDMSMLKKCIEDKERVHTLYIRRSLAEDKNPMREYTWLDDEYLS